MEEVRKRRQLKPEENYKSIKRQRWLVLRALGLRYEAKEF
jgi:hypothetical protein